MPNAQVVRNLELIIARFLCAKSHNKLYASVKSDKIRTASVSSGYCVAFIIEVH